MGKIIDLSIEDIATILTALDHDEEKAKKEIKACKEKGTDENGNITDKNMKACIEIWEHSLKGIRMVKNKMMI